MMRSLFSGTSGLRTHQTRIDVIGNNISNVNTNGYKNSRANFRTTILQTLSSPGAASDDRGSINPKQVGLGTTAASIDPDFNQGNLETTGRRGDVAIEGNGLFVLDGGGRPLYSRNGAMTVDQQGMLVELMNGFYVQGWNADLEGVLDNTGALEALEIPIGGLTIARATSYVDYIGNLDAEADGFAMTEETEGRITTNPFSAAAQTFSITADDGTVDNVTVPQITAGGAYTSDAVPIDLGNLTAGVDIDVVVTTAGAPVTATYTVPAVVPGTLDAFVSDWNTQMAGHVLAVKESDTTVRFFDYSVATGGQGADSSITFRSVPASGATAADVQALGLQDGVPQTFGASANPDPEYLALVTAYELNQATDPALGGNGTATAATDGSGRLIVESLIAGLQGRLNITDAVGSTAINDIFGAPNQRVDIDTYRTSVITYDSLGVDHTINLDFNRQGDSRIWEYRAVDEDGNDIVPGTPTSGTISFDNQGRSQTSSIQVEMTLDTGAVTPQQIALQMDQLNQFAGDPTVTASEQDGVEMGTLESYLISPDGVITGEFTNGLNQTLGQIALATFNNPGGLTQVGTSMWSESVASGTAQVGAPESASRGSTVQGTLEASNVDLANEFTQLIIGQRGFQANARIITTSDEMLNELANLRR
jgi:flagellar hook protein FlgE